MLLTTIAASLINVATLAFSLTIVAMVLAAQQLGPCLLRTFRRDRFERVLRALDGDERSRCEADAV